jgi:glutaryl-CoA dehydrogenase
MIAAVAATPARSDFYALDALLSAEELAVRDRVRAFCDEHVLPHAADWWDRAEFPFGVLPHLAETGIVGGTISGYGCPGLTRTALGVANMELARGDGSLATFLGVQTGLAMQTIALFADEESKERWLPPLARLDAVGAFALTEPDHGSDANLLETTARGLTLNGRKRWIGNASFADVIVVWARGEDDRVGAYLVEKGAPGLEISVITGKATMRSVWQTDIGLHDVEASAKLGGRFGEVLVRARPTIAWRAAGHALAAYEHALAYARGTERFGRPIAGFQLVQEKLARMLGEVTAMQLLCLRLSQLEEVSEGQASLGKLHCAARARWVVQQARDILGGNGILLENHVARHHADMEAVFTFEGTDSIQALVVGRELTGIGAFT